MPDTSHFGVLFEDANASDVARQVWDEFEAASNTEVHSYPEDEFVPGEEFQLFLEHNEVEDVINIRHYDATDEDRPIVTPAVPCFELVKPVDIWRNMDDPSDYIEAVIALVKKVYLATTPQPSFAYGLDPGSYQAHYSERGPPISAENLTAGPIDYVCWLMIFPPSMVESYGQSFLLDAPAWRTEELEDGSILLVATPDPSDRHSLDLSPLREYFGTESHN